MNYLKAARYVIVNALAFVGIDTALHAAGIEPFSTLWLGVFAMVGIAVFNAIV